MACSIKNSIEEKRKKQYNEIENQEKTEKQQNYNNTGLNTVLYTGMNGKQVTLWKFILGIILLVGGAFGAVSIAIN